jgi:hypothetical protein
MISFFLKKNIETITYRSDPNQPGLTFQIYDPSHETMITTNNTNQNKL